MRVSFNRFHRLWNHNPYFFTGVALPLYYTHLDLSYLRPTLLALHLSGGLIGLPLLIITLLFANDTPSQPELVNFCIAWVINSISYSLS
jgi:hypothetical protein